MEIILASGSPRRTEILNNAGISHKIIPSNYEENMECNLLPAELVKALSKGKALDIFKDHQDACVIGADTVVTINNTILGKPKNKEDAIRMLRLLSGKAHSVLTGVTICYNNLITSFVDTTKVTFDCLTDEDIEDYLLHENVYDKAGSYAIQGYASRFIKRLNGNYFNVVGLPIEKLTKKLKKIGVL